jgi:hypothetical protein
MLQLAEQLEFALEKQHRRREARRVPVEAEELQGDPLAVGGCSGPHLAEATFADLLEKTEFLQS